MPRRVTNALLAAVLAPPCALCGRVLDAPLDSAVCDACWSSLDLHVTAFALAGITRASALGPYEGPLRQLLHALKYHQRRSLGRGLSRLMRRHGAPVLDGADFVVPVPLHRGRRRERGFNQSALLAQDLGVPVLPLLARVRRTIPQVSLPATARRANVVGAFALRFPWWWRIVRARRHSPAGRVLVLVDDVATTGATLEACAEALTASGAAEVRALTAARVETAGR